MTENMTAVDDWQQTVLQYNLEPLSAGGYLAIAIFLTVTGLVATGCNSATLIMFMRNKKLRQKPHNLLLLNLAVADLGICVLGYPFTTISSFAQRWIWGTVVCKIQGFTNFTLALTSMYTLTCISVYRYVALCKPHHNHRLDQKTTKRIIGFIWGWNLLITVPPLAGWTTYTYEPWGTGCSIDWTNPRPDYVAYIVYCMVFCYISTLCIMMYCYYCTVRRLKRLQRTIQAARHSVFSLTEAETIHKMAAEGKVTWITMAMVATFVLVWSPYAWVGLWTTLGGAVPLWVKTLPNMLAKTSCLLNPLIYIFTSSTFRQRITACVKRNARVHDSAQKEPASNKNIYRINRTGEGIYIGENKVQFRAAETTMF